MPPYPLLIAVTIGGYLLGSIPFGLIATRLGGAGDIRKIGSGNIGATNVLRSGRRDLAAITLLGDGGKGAVAWPVGVLAGATWIAVAALLRISSLGALMAAALAPLYALALHSGHPVIVLAAMMAVRRRAL